MLFNKLPVESLNASHDELDSSYGTNVDDPASPLLFYYDLRKVKRFNQVTLLFASIALVVAFVCMGHLLQVKAPLLFAAFLGPAIIFAIGMNCFRMNSALKSRMKLPALAVRAEGLTVYEPVTADKIIPWSAISNISVSKFFGSNIIRIAIHDSEEARMSVISMGIPSYRDFTAIQKYLFNLISDNKRVSIRANELYVDAQDVVNTLNERAAYYLHHHSCNEIGIALTEQVAE